jgi:hypothetical protein
VSVSRPEVLVTAFGPSPGVKGTLLRMWEVAGKSGKIVVKLPFGTVAKAAQPVDWHGDHPVSKRALCILVRKIGISSFDRVSSTAHSSVASSGKERGDENRLGNECN